jgi:predicted PurR-regulated permease PerM
VRAVGAVASALVAIFFALFISIYLSFDAHKIRGLLPQLLPPANKEEIDALLHRLGLIWEAFLRGQITLMLMIGVIVWIGAVLLGLPQPVFFGFLSGTLEMIPSLGPLLAFIPAVIVALLFGSSHLPVTNLSFAVIIAAFYLLVQFFENQFIVPRVLGKAVDLHPLVVIIGALAAGSQFGVLGIFLAAPAIASGREIFLYLYSKILETPTPPPPLETKSIWKDIKSFFKRGRDALIRPFRRFVL